MVMIAVGNRSQLWLGGLRILVPTIYLKPAMVGHCLGVEAREEAVAQVEVGRRVFSVSFCQVSSGVGPSKSY